MKHSIILLLSLFVFLRVFSQPVNYQYIYSEVNTCWHTKDFKAYEGAALSNKEIKEFCSRDLCLNSKRIVFFTEVVNDPKFTIHEITDKSYLWDNYSLAKQDLWPSSKKIYEIVVSGNKKQDSGETYDFLYDGHYLYYFEDNVRFRFYRPEKNISRSSTH